MDDLSGCGLIDVPCQLNGWVSGVQSQVTSTVSSWIPDWVWPLLPWWPVLAVILVVGVAYRFAGWPGVVAAAGAIGFIFGRRSVKPEAPVVPAKPAVQLPNPPYDKPKTWSAPKPPVKVKKKPKTLEDFFKDLDKRK